MWRSTAATLQALPRDGSAIEAHGHIDIYEIGGKYQLYVDMIRPAGEGLLFQEFLRLKAKLEAEGLFAPERKRPIPAFPRRIGIVTSPTGAALQDILKTLQRRYRLAEVILSPSLVQGEEAPAAITTALDAINRLAKPDVILLARGGGSLEDLWAFNSENIARAIVASPTPVITGIGHETDFTIADFAADLRAPTPTAAAELATPHSDDLKSSLGDLQRRMTQSLRAYLASLRSRKSHLELRLSAGSPLKKIQSERQRLDEWVHRALRSQMHRLEIIKAELNGITQRLDALNPIAVFRRGYAMVTRQDGTLIRSVTNVSQGDIVHGHLADGRLEANITRQLNPGETDI